ncbi:PP2C family protein-serine/threonine phosphatase [Yinghuangia seranimata]|uniref:PP2C family protein-serine/threonine phosphatase n=1 Tax=Yinghuangia seranimata TaxID=408067 RepID=UPI00248C7009|nr:PP2C family protein-serine/threonine phosphatase [Yinghuangia seranimata]MDI2131029.1 PP2C family protein-serine/threonine phosphatase [Yinghuangia seranimata]
MGTTTPDRTPPRPAEGAPGRAALLSAAQWLLRLLPVGVIVIVVVIGFATPPEVHVGPLLAVAPALAGLTRGSPRTPLLVGLLAALAMIFLTAAGETSGTGEPFVTLLSIFLVSLTGWAGVLVRRRQERTLEDVRSVAEAAQQVLLSPVPRRIGPVRVGVRYRAAAAEARIGGDLYEVILTPHGVRAVVGDVRGKGLGAVQTAAAVLGAFREAAYEEPGLPGVVRRIGASMSRRLEENVEEFVTLVLVGFPPQGGVQVVNCGHPAPLLLRSARAEFMEPPSPVPPLGIVDPDLFEIPVLAVPVLPGDRVLLYTDGIVEARDRHGVFYPLLDRAPDSLDGVEDTLDRLEADVERHVGQPLEDDAAMVLMMYAPAGDTHEAGSLPQVRTREM